MILEFLGAWKNKKWVEPAHIETDLEGKIKNFSEKPIGKVDKKYLGYLLPGIVNAHSHAFQYAMAGLAEKSKKQDDFWSWRKKMYELANSLTPDDMLVIATSLYKALLANGYTWVVEFHYLHHDKGGKRYSKLSEMSQALIEAAKISNIGLTLVPVLYQNSDFGKEALSHQKRFLLKDFEEYQKLLDELSSVSYQKFKLGIGVHSLRAVWPSVAQKFFERFSQGPIHLHIAEQEKEVEACVKYTKKRPLRWLFDNCNVDKRFSLVHCTQASSEELKILSKSKATVVLCPTTEANLGDGFFNFFNFFSEKGNFSIGSDSHVGLNPFEELRWLDYEQRLLLKRRALFEPEDYFERMLMGGFQSAGLKKSYFNPGDFLDGLIVASKNLENSFERMSHVIYTLDVRSYLGTLVSGKELGSF